MTNLYNNETLWVKLLTTSSTDEPEVEDEPSFLRDSIVRQCTSIGGIKERDDNVRFQISKVSVTTNIEDCSSIVELIQTKSILAMKRYIGESCLVSISVNSKELQEFNKINLGKYGRTYLSTYFQAIYGKVFEASQNLSLSWARILGILLFGTVEEGLVFNTNNPFLELISNNQEVILEIVSQVEKVFYTEYPTHFNSYVLCGLSITNVVTRWLRQLFFNFLDLSSIFQLLGIVKEYGLRALVFYCVLFLKKQASFEYCQEYKFEACEKPIYEGIDIDAEWIGKVFENDFKHLREKYTAVRLTFEKSN